MQRCPKCKRTYQDDVQKFCTFDGSRLVSDRSTAPTSYDLDRTAIDLDKDLTTRADNPNLRQTIPSVPQSEPPKPAFDPYKTIAGLPQQQQTGDIGSPSGGLPFTPQSTARPPPPPPQQAPTGGSQQPPQQTPTGGFAPPNQQQQQATTGGFAPTQQQTSAPLPQQPMSPPLPPAPTIQPQHAPPQHAPQPQAQHAAQAPARRSRAPLIIGGVVVLLFLLIVAVAAAYFVLNRQGFFARHTGSNANARTEENRNAVAENANTTANVNTSTNTNANTNMVAQPSTYVPPPNAVKFTNTVDRLSDSNLTAHFVPFTFYYTDSWQIDPKSGKQGSSSFIEVRRELSPTVVQESLTVGWYESGGTIDADRQRFSTLVETYSNKYAKGLDNYQKVSEGPTKVNSLDGYEFRFQGHSMTERGDVKYWGRVIFLPMGSEGSKNGVRLTMFTTSLAPELGGVDDGGVHGQLPLNLDSFRFGD